MYIYIKPGFMGMYEYIQYSSKSLTPNVNMFLAKCDKIHVTSMDLICGYDSCAMVNYTWVYRCHPTIMSGTASTKHITTFIDTLFNFI